MFSLSVMADSFMTLWTVACQVHLSVEFPRQEYWSWLPFLSPGNLPDPAIKSVSPALGGDSLLLSHQGRPIIWIHNIQNCSGIYLGSHILSGWTCPCIYASLWMQIQETCYQVQTLILLATWFQMICSIFLPYFSSVKGEWDLWPSDRVILNVK